MRKPHMALGAAALALSMALLPSVAHAAIPDSSLTINRTCYPNNQVYTMLNTGAATEYYWSSQQDRYNVKGLTWPGAVSTTVTTGFRNIFSTVYVKAGYVYAQGTGAYCRA